MGGNHSRRMRKENKCERVSEMEAKVVQTRVTELKDLWQSWVEKGEAGLKVVFGDPAHHILEVVVVAETIMEGYVALLSEIEMISKCCPVFECPVGTAVMHLEASELVLEEAHLAGPLVLHNHLRIALFELVILEMESEGRREKLQMERQERLYLSCLAGIHQRKKQSLEWLNGRKSLLWMWKACQKERGCIWQYEENGLQTHAMSVHKREIRLVENVFVYAFLPQRDQNTSMF